MTDSDRPVGFVKKPLTMWFNGSDYVIARSADEASALIALHLGVDDAVKAFEEVGGDDVIPLWVSWEPMQRCYRVAEQQESEAHIRRLASYHWVSLFGMGYLASVDT